MDKKIRIALAQINSTVGDLPGNCRKISEYIGKAEEAGADIVVFPELALTGYPPEDLLMKAGFVRDNLGYLKSLAKSVSGIAAILGFVDQEKDRLYNSAAIIYNKKIRASYKKMLLPNYGVFDERRYFYSGEKISVFKLGDYVFGVNICEDIWHKNGPTREQVKKGAEFILNINASPFQRGKILQREKLVSNLAKANKVPVAYVNLVGGQDELVFDGQSMVCDGAGKVVARARGFCEDLLLVDLALPSTKPKTKKALVISKEFTIHEENAISPVKNKLLEPIDEVYQALSLGLKDYVLKNSFQKVVVGVSGGVDSALVSAIATHALGKENVVGVFMPSRYSSAESKEDAETLAANLEIKLHNVPIDNIFNAYLDNLQPLFSQFPADITEENLQARIRGNILMALSNKFRWLVLTTGNKSEMSTGYATLYGDMAGGLAVLKDVPKYLVYQLCEFINSKNNLIPKRILTKAPTAELRPNQKDSDTLPPYDVLDKILDAYIEQEMDFSKIVSRGCDPKIVEKVLKMVDRSEYKRRQSPPGIKITYKAFGRDRRMPITNKYLPEA